MANEKFYISQITLGATTYDLKDLEARIDIEAIKGALSGGVVFRGETSTVLTDGATTNPITINNKSYTAVQGDLVASSNKEFIFDGTHWVELGDLSALGDLAWKNSAEGTYTPAGTVSQPTFTGTAMTSSGNFTPEGTVEIGIGAGTANFTPAGTVSQPTFTGTELESTGSYTPAGSVGIAVGAGTANYTPAGSVSKPDITVTPTTDSVYSITDIGTLPELQTSVVNEVLTISFSQGTLPTKGAAQTVMTGASAALDNAPAFTGTGVDLEASFTGTAATLSVSGTPTGTVSQPSFTGTQGGVTVSGTPEGTVSQPTFTGTQGGVTVSGTPEGTISQPTFTGTGVELTADFTGTQGSFSVTGTPEGTVSQPTFTGTEATITVS